MSLATKKIYSVWNWHCLPLILPSFTVLRALFFQAPNFNQIQHGKEPRRNNANFVYSPILAVSFFSSSLPPFQVVSTGTYITSSLFVYAHCRTPISSAWTIDPSRVLVPFFRSLEQRTTFLQYWQAASLASLPSDINPSRPASAAPLHSYYWTILATCQKIITSKCTGTSHIPLRPCTYSQWNG